MKKTVMVVLGQTHTTIVIESLVPSPRLWMLNITSYQVIRFYCARQRLYANEILRGRGEKSASRFRISTVYSCTIISDSLSGGEDGAFNTTVLGVQ